MVRRVEQLREVGRTELQCPVTRSARQCTHFGRSGPTPQDLRYSEPPLSAATSRVTASPLRPP